MAVKWPLFLKVCLVGEWSHWPFGLLFSKLKQLIMDRPHFGRNTHWSGQQLMLDSWLLKERK